MLSSQANRAWYVEQHRTMAVEDAVPTTLGTSTFATDGEIFWFSLGTVCGISNIDLHGEGRVRLSGHG